MFSDLSDADLAALITKLRDALVSLVAGEKVAEIRYGEMGRKFHPTTEAGARSVLNDAVAEQSRRSGGGRSRAIHPRGV